MRILLTCVVVVASAAATFAGGQTLDLSRHTIVDLSHAYGPSTLFWPTSPTKFELQKLAFGKTEGGYFYAANTLSTPEHGGTHLDAPIHFFEGGWTTEQIPLEQLIAPAVVIDVTGRAAADRDYRTTRDDVLQFEKAHGPIARGTIVPCAGGLGSENGPP